MSKKRFRIANLLYTSQDRLKLFQKQIAARFDQSSSLIGQIVLLAAHTHLNLKKSSYPFDLLESVTVT